MESDVAARTLRLLTLLQSRPSWAGCELVEHLGTSPRTLRRDLARLGELGYTVHSRSGPGGHYRLGAGTRLPPLALDDDEVVALAVGLRMAEDRLGDDAAARALVKLERVLPGRLARLVTEVAEHSEVVRHAPESDAIGAVLAPLTRAAAGDREARFDYVDQHGRSTSRRVDSTRCLLARGWWYLLAFDLDRDDWRVFRLDRITDVVVGVAPLPRRDPPADDLTAWLESDFGRIEQSRGG